MKPFYKSKEVWVVILTIMNTVSYYAGGPAIEPTPELLTAIIGAVGAIRVLLTETKLALTAEW